MFRVKVFSNHTLYYPDRKGADEILLSNTLTSECYFYLFIYLFISINDSTVKGRITLKRIQLKRLTIT